MTKTTQAELERVLSKPSLARHVDGKEFLDPTPMAPPLGYKQQPSMVDHIRNMIRSEKLRQEALDAGYETFEEADDFDVGDDIDPHSPYEVDFEPEGVRQVREAVEAAEKKAVEAAAKIEEAPPASPAPAKDAE